MGTVNKGATINKGATVVVNNNHNIRWHHLVDRTCRLVRMALVARCHRVVEAMLLVVAAGVLRPQEPPAHQERQLAVVAGEVHLLPHLLEVTEEEQQEVRLLVDTEVRQEVRAGRMEDPVVTVVLSPAAQDEEVEDPEGEEDQEDQEDQVDQVDEEDQVDKVDEEDQVDRVPQVAAVDLVA
mmetsp:Transcript_7783/g.23964  ORF Transcript_7783/g.23964 Transcript_7783/m.23964 type:complete len:181 (+) Transcript_7783:229-771(+)